MIEYENLRKVNQPYFKEFNTVFNNVLESGWFVLGHNVDEFEKEFADIWALIQDLMKYRQLF